MQTSSPTTTPDSTEIRFDAWTIVLGLFAFGNLATGLWMLADPPHWYENLPAGVPDFGPMNEHFIRDIGAVFTLMAIGLGGAAVRPPWRVPACLMVTGFYVMHAIVHIIDTARGLVGPEHWSIDFPGIYLPALIMIFVTWRISKSPG